MATHTHTHTHTHTLICAYTLIYTHTHTNTQNTHTQNTHTHAQTHTHKHIHGKECVAPAHATRGLVGKFEDDGWSRGAGAAAREPQGPFPTPRLGRGLKLAAFQDRERSPLNQLNCHAC
jgi:hypothetical protein